MAIVFFVGGFDPKTVLWEQLWPTFLRSTRFSLEKGTKGPILHRELGGASLSDRDLLLLLVFAHSNVVPVHLWQFICNFWDFLLFFGEFWEDFHHFAG